MKGSMKENTDLMLENLGRMIYSYEPLKLEDELKESYKALQPLKIINPGKAMIEVRMPGYTVSEVLSEICKNKLSAPFFMLTIYATDKSKCHNHDTAEYFFSKTNDVEKLQLNERMHKKKKTKKMKADNKINCI
ncbi:MAG: hypothetical protein WCO13_08565 [Bacteroidota bacterium]